MSVDATLSLLAIALLYNLVVFGIYWRDKRAARNGDWRVKESTLLLIAFAGGGVGAFSAQRLLRHKTRKPPFPVVLPIFLVLQLAILSVMILVPGSFAMVWRVIINN
jgi:uncharacterized membrane protein YsdA (DUF1294 family)